MVETFFGFKKTPFCDSPDPKQLFSSQAWNQAKARLQFLGDHHGAGLLTGEVGAGKSTAAAASPPRSIPTSIRSCICTGLPDPRSICSANWRWSSIWNRPTTAAIWWRQISQTIVRLNQSKKQHPILICDEAQLLCHAALEQLPCC